MKTGAILILIASVISANGGSIEVDAGRLAGLRVGDRGSVFYELKVREEVRRVDVTTAEVISVEEDRATLRAADASPVRTGFRVEFTLSTERLERRATIPKPPDESAGLKRDLAAARSRIEALETEVEGGSRERARLERALEAARGSSRSETERLVEAEEARRAAEERARELEDRLTAARMYAGGAMAELRESLDRAEARAALLESELEKAERALAVEAERSSPVEATPEPALEVAQAPSEAPDQVAPQPVPEVAEPSAPPRESVPAPREPAVAAEPPAENEIEDAAGSPDPTGGMVRLDSDRYELGLPVSEARFYNQTPRFSRQVDAIWIDRAPVGAADFAAVSGTAEPGAGVKTAVTYAEAAAYCRSVGKRLPTEVEWEAAVTTIELDGRPGLLEWTASWYEPYPGNDRPEVDYGQRFRVIRASVGSPRDRRYMSPGDRDTSVGFRCVRDAAPE